MTRLGLEEDESFCDCAPRKDVLYYCEGSSVEPMKSKQRAKDLLEIENEFHALRRRAEDAGDAFVASFMEGYNTHLKTMKDNIGKSSPSGSGIRTVDVSAFTPSKIITPKVKDSVFSTPLLCSFGGEGQEAPPNCTATSTVPDDITQSGAAPVSSCSFTSLNATSLSSSNSFRTSDGTRSVFTSTPIAKLQPMFAPPVTSVKPNPQASFDASNTTVPPSSPCAADLSTTVTPVLRQRLSDFYCSDLDFKRSVDITVKNFESATTPARRSPIKRTIIERITVCSKKHAPREDILTTSEYLCNLFKGKLLIGISDQPIQLQKTEEVVYAMNVTCDHYLRLVEQDLDLAEVVSSILIFISSEIENFSRLLLGKLFSSSILLTMDHDECSEKCVWLDGKPSDISSHFLAQQRSIVRIFFTLHVVSTRDAHNSNFPLKNVWRALAFIMNIDPVPLASPFVLNELLKICGRELLCAYGRVMRKVLFCVRTDLLEVLEEQLGASKKLQRAGQAMHLSVLRNTIGNLE